MNAKRIPFSRITTQFGLLLVVAVAIGLIPSAVAREQKATNTDRDQRSPLKLTIDSKPIDRNAPDRVSYAPIVEKTSASVVFVYSTKQVRARDIAPFLNDPMLRRFFGVPGAGRIPDQTQRGLGSGVIVSADGYILTSNHVIEGADDVKVSIGESLTRHDAKVVGTDALVDIAVLKIEAKGLTPATFGDSDQLKVGDPVFAIGNPFGVGQSVSRGIVSALGRGIGVEQIEDFIQTDAAINMGNSGGALIDSSGRVVGINTVIFSGSGGFAGVGFAIPINLARGAAEQIVSTGSVTRGFLGIAPQPLTPELATHFGTQSGALVAEVSLGSPADKAGLQAGDVITKVNDKEIREARQLLLAVSQFAPGTTVQLPYQRDGKTGTAKATLDRRPDQNMTSVPRDRKTEDKDGVLDGVALTDLTPQIREQLQIPPRVQGAVIAEVDPASPSARQGLREGDVIIELGRKPVKNSGDAEKLSAEIKGPRVMARVWRDGQTRFVVIDESTG